MSELYLASIGIFIFFSACAVGIIGLTFALIPSKSKSYRKYLSNMYVASRIRQLALEDKLDLDIEGKRFEYYERKISIRDKDLDKTIEADLKERVDETYKKEKSKK